MKPAIVSTMRQWSPQAGEWIRYHLQAGFDTLYVFVNEPPAAPITVPAGVRVTLCDLEWWHSFASHPLYPHLDPDVRMGTEAWEKPQPLMSRQILNAERAIEWACEEGVDWLLHIDGDELFDPAAATVCHHFRDLDWLGIRQAHYLNHEAVSVPENDNCGFASRWFRKNRAMLDAAQRACVEERLNRRPWFLSYGNGKSAVKPAPGVRPAGVHSFHAPTFGGSCTLASPAILHYPYSTYQRFRNKHVALGTYDPTSLFGENWRPPRIFIEALACIERNDEQGLRRLYDEWVLLQPEDRRVLQAAGAIVEIDRPARILRRSPL